MPALTRAAARVKNPWEARRICTWHRTRKVERLLQTHLTGEPVDTRPVAEVIQ